MKIIKELFLLLIIIAFSIIYHISGQLITKNVLKKGLNFSKDSLNENTLKHKREFKSNISNASKIGQKINFIFLNEYSNLSFFVEIDQLKNKNEKNNPICNINNCFMPHGVCVGDNICKCAKNYGNLFMIDLIERIKINNIENFLSKLMSQNNSSYAFAEYIKNFYSENFCDYHKKSQLITFFLESVFLIGIGHFFLHRFFHGLFKLLLIILIILLVFSMKKSKIEIKFFMSISSDKPSLEFLLNFIHFILILSYLFIQTIDLLMIASNEYKDGFGFPMISWNSPYYNR
jgi:hypothetical protein